MLIKAIKRNNIYEVKRLLKKGVSVDSPDVFGMSPLMCAAMNGHVDILKELLVAGADLNAKDYKGRSVLDYTTQAPDKVSGKIMGMLIEAGVDTSNHKWKTAVSFNPASHILFAYKHPKLMYMMHSVPPSGYCELLLAAYAENGHIKQMKNLLDNTFIYEYGIQNAMSIAVENGHTSVIKLLANRINVDADMLQTACMHGYSDMVDYISETVDINRTDKLGRTPLMLAAIKGHKKVAEVLLSKNANLHCVDKEGNTPLMQALAYGHVEMATFLIKRGGLSNARNNAGKTALDIAKENDLLTDKEGKISSLLQTLTEKAGDKVKEVRRTPEYRINPVQKAVLDL